MEKALFFGRLLILLVALMVAEAISIIVRYVKYRRYRNWKDWYTFKHYMRDKLNVLDFVCLALVFVAALGAIVSWLFEPLMN